VVARALSRGPGLVGASEMATGVVVGPDVAEYSALSLRLDIGCADHLAPLRGILGNELAKFSGCVRKHDAAQVAEPSLELRIGERLVDLFVELGNDPGGAYS
jgi:hypothetical protein